MKSVSLNLLNCLHVFLQRPLDKLEALASGNQLTVEKRLILWKFESELKKSYEDLIHAIEAVCKSPVDAVVIHACQTLKQLLSERPEQEQVLYRILNVFNFHRFSAPVEFANE